MQRFGIGEKEMAMARLLWAREGISSGEIVKLCKKEFNWAKSTTYTMLRRLQEHGLFNNEKSVVTSLMSEEEYLFKVGEDLINDKFNGSLVEFVKVVSINKKLSAKEKEEIKKILA